MLNTREQTKYKMFRIKGTACADLVTSTGQVTNDKQFEFFMFKRNTEVAKNARCSFLEIVLSLYSLGFVRHMVVP